MGIGEALCILIDLDAEKISGIPRDSTNLYAPQSMVIINHHYGLDAAKLVEKCSVSLHSILDYLEENSNGAQSFRKRSYHLIELNDGECHNM